MTIETSSERVHRESFKKMILESEQLPKFMEAQFLNMLEYMENNESIIEALTEREAKLMAIIQKCAIQDYEDFEEVRDLADEFLNKIYCDICGDYHELDNIPLNCQTGDGE